MLTNKSTGYTTKSVCQRGAGRKFPEALAAGAIHMQKEDDGKWYFFLIEPDAPAVAEKSAKKPRAKSNMAQKDGEPGPCFIVWDLCDKMVGARRTDVIKACVAAGVNYNTARTQYQHWYTARKNSDQKSFERK